jgi:hypothetical protein
VKLEANFKADFLAMARQTLTEEWGHEEAQQIPDNQIVMTFLDSLRRRPATRPRRIWTADDFQCPRDYTAGWEALQKKIRSGDDLSPHLSRGHSSLKALDGLLNEWGVHHLHLGTTPSSDGSGRIERTGPVLFARITDDDFHAISVCLHGEWEKSSILESLHRNWPQAIRDYRLNGVQGEPLTEAQRRNLRKVNVQAPTSVSDGTVYMAIGGGVSSNGISAMAVRASDMLLVDVERLQSAIEQQFSSFVPHLQTGGYTNESAVRATLVGITPQAFRVFFPDYRVLSNVTLEGGLFHGRRERAQQGSS